MKPIIDSMVNDLLACVVMLDGDAYVPVMAAIYVFVPLFFAGGGFVAAFCFFMSQVFSFAEMVGEILADWLRKRFARKPPAE